MGYIQMLINELRNNREVPYEVVEVLQAICDHLENLEGN